MGSDKIRLDPDLLCEQTKEMEDFLSERVINQSRAVKCVVSAYDQFNSQIWQSEKPILSALFLGPSGVGKTYIPEVLADYLFDDPNAITKIECANYVERHEIAKLLGSPPGYVGYNEPPLLSQENISMPAVQHATANLLKTDRKARELKREIESIGRRRIITTNQYEADGLTRLYMQKTDQYQNYIFEKIKNIKPVSIILFDEIEKAHSSLHYFLLEVTSKGRTRLGNGEEVLFYNSFIFMTSNAGSHSIAEIVKGGKEIGFLKKEKLGTKEDPIYARAMLELKKIFTTEFLGRIEKNIVVFKNLSRDDIGKIIDIQINALITHLSKNFPLELIIGGDIKDFILEKSGDHPEYGARLVGDKIDRHIKEPLTRMINSGQILKGDKIILNLENEKICFTKEGAAIAKPAE